MTLIKLLKRVLSWAAVLFCLLSIYYLSAQPAAKSSANSKGVVAGCLEVTTKVAQIQLEEPEKDRLDQRIDEVAREYMHGVVYLVLGLALSNALLVSGVKGRQAWLLALSLCVLYAVSDEIHQVFVPGRSFQFSDLAMDTAGSIIGIWLRVTGVT
ncbi:MAG: VanZ family protein, partial [Peptococcaceae bacterium]|nr:VanZ family protein [Peptococcaceae bacterium]